MQNSLFKNKYRVQSARLEGYDYSNNGYYFITICTYKKQHFFGKIINKGMMLNQLGKLANKYWRQIPEHFKNIKLDEYIIMPNHIHGIIGIDNGVYVENATHGCNDDDMFRGVPTNEGNATHGGRDEACLVSTDVDKTSNPVSQQMQKISPKSGSLSVIIGSYKSIVTRESKQIINYFTWQPRFYDHIIRDDKSLNKIRQYIINNPAKWEFDRNNKQNI